MKKLTQTEANELIRLAWSNVERYGKGSYRFGQSLWNLIPEEQYKLWRNTRDADFYFEQNPDIVMEKFFKFFVEE